MAEGTNTQSDIEPYDFEDYRVRLRKKVYGFLPLAILWNRRVLPFRWTDYDRQFLDGRFGDEWPFQLSLAEMKPRYWIQGRSGQGEWQELSQWRLDELRRADDEARAQAKYVPKAHAQGESRAESASIDEAMRRAYARAVPKPGVGEAVYHAMDHHGLGATQTVELVNRLGIWADVHPKKLARHRKNGAQRAKAGALCRFCPS